MAVIEKANSMSGVTYSLQVQDGGHLREASELVSYSPGGDRGQVAHQRSQLLVKLQTPQLKTRALKVRHSTVTTPTSTQTQ